MSGSLTPLLRSDRAAAPRTLMDILRSTAARYGAESALDDGSVSLTYRELLQAAEAVAGMLHARGVRRGDRVGVRMASGTNDLYVAILGILQAGAAYVPVDADDPEHRAKLVFSEAAVHAVVRDGFEIEVTGQARLDEAPPDPASPPSPDDDAWIIFTSGSTGVPKGVAVTHRSAAAFVDAEADLFLRAEPLGPDDRVLAGLSVGFDASCEEMWLAWRNGACLVPAPRSLVRSGADLGPWLIAQGITVVSTVPTLAALWPDEALEQVRLLIFGGEACPPSLVARVAGDPACEVWNTYGPTEATVVACAALLAPDEPVRIGLPLDGWNLAVVDDAGEPVLPGEVGELIIGGVGLARYLDPAKDAERFAAMPSLGWDRAYRSGDLVRLDEGGLLFVGRADDQVKVGGRRIELGEVDNALQSIPGVTAAAAAVRQTPAGSPVLVGYVVAAADLDLRAAAEHLRAEMPAALVPRLALLEELPVRSSGKVDRDALPWPLPTGSGGDGGGDLDQLGDDALWVAGQWTAVLGMEVGDADADFFEHGGSSLSAALLVSALRERYPGATVADVYDYPRLAAQVERLFGLSAPATVTDPRIVAPTPRRTRVLQTLLSLPLQTVVGLRWLVWLLTIDRVAGATLDVPWASTVSWWWIAAGWLGLVSPFGRMAIAVVGARLLLRGVEPGTYPRGGSVHLRLWAAEQLADAAGAVTLAGAPWISYYARALGATIGPGVDLHSIPPVTGFLKIGAGASIEPEVDLLGHWLDGDRLHLGRVSIGAGASIGSRTTLLPGARVGKGAQVAPGSMVDGRVPAGERWSGSPARPASPLREPWPEERPKRATRWVGVYGFASIMMSMLPLVAVAVGLTVLGWAIDGTEDLGAATGQAFLWVPAATAAGFASLTVLIGVSVRLLGLGVRAGTYPVRSRVGFQVWATERLLDLARTLLFPLYASLATPTWLRLLGADIGKDVEASTVLLLPKMTTVADGAFLADDTMVASYALRGGYLRIAPAKIGKRAFLGNSGITAGGRTVPKRGLVAVLSAAPRKSKAGSSWLGSPPVKLRRRAVAGDQTRTFAPPTRLRVARALIELCRFVPVAMSVAIGVGVLAVLQLLVQERGLAVAALASGGVLLLAGSVAAVVTTVAKWVVVGRITSSEHPLWSSFVWRNEVVDTFVEMVAAPWFANAAAGSPGLSTWLRSMGATIGRGVWCESYWLPEADLVHLADGASVNRGCVLQTHLFHDRVMSTDTVELAEGATIGPHGVILPAASIGAHATVGPASLIMRGESVPSATRWAGNPIAPWRPSKQGAKGSG